MPFFYDVKRQFTASGSANTEVTDIVGKTVANQQILAIYAIYAAARFTTAGGAQLRAKFCTVTAATGGTAQTPHPRNLLFPASQSTWVDSTSAITAGGTTIIKATIGFAQTGGMGGWQALMPQDTMQMQPNAASPLDFEITDLAATASVVGDITVEIGEGL